MKRQHAHATIPLIIGGVLLAAFLTAQPVRAQGQGQSIGINLSVLSAIQALPHVEEANPDAQGFMGAMSRLLATLAVPGNKGSSQFAGRYQPSNTLSGAIKVAGSGTISGKVATDYILGTVVSKYDGTVAADGAMSVTVSVQNLGLTYTYTDIGYAALDADGNLVFSGMRDNTTPVSYVWYRK